MAPERLLTRAGWLQGSGRVHLSRQALRPRGARSQWPRGELCRQEPSKVGNAQGVDAAMFGESTGSVISTYQRYPRAFGSEHGRDGLVGGSTDETGWKPHFFHLDDPDRAAGPVLDENQATISVELLQVLTQPDHWVHLCSVERNAVTCVEASYPRARKPKDRREGVPVFGIGSGPPGQRRNMEARARSLYSQQASAVVGSPQPAAVDCQLHQPSPHRGDSPRTRCHRPHQRGPAISGTAARRFGGRPSKPVRPRR